MGYIKYQVVSRNSGGWVSVGVVFMLTLLFLVTSVLYLHLKVVVQLKNELLSKNAEKKSQNPLIDSINCIKDDKRGMVKEDSSKPMDQ